MIAFPRRTILTGAAAVAAAPALGQTADLRLPGGPSLRPIAARFADKRGMIVQRVRPPLLETPFDVFADGVFTPNDRFFVRWHWADIPTSVDTRSWSVKLRGAVERPQALSYAALLKLPRTEIAAVNQCSGNSRGLFQPRVAGGEWAHGAMGNARWTGVRLRDVLALAGLRAGAVAVRFGGADQPVVPDGPKFLKSLAVDHAMSEDVLIAFGMNGAPLPILNGAPLRLIVPGWFSTYWVKALNDLEVLTAPDDNFWMAKAYKIPANRLADVAPGAKDYPTVPIGRMPPRSFITAPRYRAKLAAGAPLAIEGFAFGGDCGLRSVEVSADGGASWAPATLGRDYGPYSFRRFSAALAAPAARGPRTLLARAMNVEGAVQPMQPNWNPSGYQRSCVEPVPVEIA